MLGGESNRAASTRSDWHGMRLGRGMKRSQPTRSRSSRRHVERTDVTQESIDAEGVRAASAPFLPFAHTVAPPIPGLPRGQGSTGGPAGGSVRQRVNTSLIASGHVGGNIGRRRTSTGGSRRVGYHTGGPEPSRWAQPHGEDDNLPVV